jgi:hypothetical protein
MICQHPKVGHLKLDFSKPQGTDSDILKSTPVKPSF